jgi:glutamate/tyrosine decarboxylase-like PLP-dependent enzyme
MKSLLEDAARRAQRYLAALPERAVRPDPEAVRRLAELDFRLPSEGRSPAAVLELLDERVGPATMAMAGPRFHGFVIGGALPVSIAASWLATAWDQNAGFYESTPGVSHLEIVALAWLNELFGLPPSTAGAFVTGATMANFTALAAARHAVLEKVGWSVDADGLSGAPPITVIVGDEAHPSLLKALGLLGLGRNRVTRVPTDAQGRMRADALPRIEGPTILCVQAGNVNTGAFDPLEALCSAAKQARAWVHVDGAFGMWAAVAPSRAHLAAGLTLADSWATDAHKWLNVPYDSGLAFVRDAAALRTAMSLTAEYLPSDSPRRHPSDFTPELSRRARGVEVWAALLSLGRDGLAELVERNCAQARRFAQRLADAGCRVLNDVVLNQVLVAFGDAATTTRVIGAIQADGTCWAGGTVWHGETAMRISVSNAATTDADVERSAAAIIDAARRVRSS